MLPEKRQKKLVDFRVFTAEEKFAAGFFS